METYYERETVMAISILDVNKASNPPWVEPNTSLDSLELSAAIQSAGILKFANQTEFNTYAARNTAGPGSLAGQTVTPWMSLPTSVSDTVQLYQFDGTAIQPMYIASKTSFPPVLASYAQCPDTTEARADQILTRSQGAIDYPATVGKGQTHIAIDIGNGYPRYVLETTQEAQVRRRNITPLKGEYEGGYLVFALATDQPLQLAVHQSTIEVRGALDDDAVAIPFGTGTGQTGTGVSLAGFVPPTLGTGGQVLRMNSGGTATYWDTFNIQDIFGSGVGSPSPGDVIVRGASGWVTEPKATGVPISSGPVPGVGDTLLPVLFKTGSNTTQFAYATFSSISGNMSLTKLQYSGAALGAVPQIVDIGGGAHEPRWQVPTFTLSANSVGPDELDAGDAAKATALRTRLGFPTTPVGAFVQIASATGYNASAVFFPGDDGLRLYHSSTDTRDIQTLPTGVEFTVGSNNYLAFYRDSATRARISSVGTSSLTLQGLDATINAGTGSVGFLGALMSAGGVDFKQGQVLGLGPAGPAPLSLGHPAIVTAHWTGTVTCASGASGNGFDTATGNTFGSVTPNTFIYSGSTYTVRQVLQDSSNAIKVTFNPSTEAIDDNWSITINGHLTLNASDATITNVARYGGISTEYTFAGQQPGTIPNTGSITVSLNRQARALPEGGTAGQRLTIASDGVDLEWQTPAAGGSPGQPGQALTVTPRQDHFTASRTTINPLAENSEYQLTIVANGAAAPLSAASNQIRVASGTTAFSGKVDWHLDIDPTHWVNNRTSGGNRLFIQAYFKKNNTIIETSREAVYIRGDEDWAPSDHVIHGSFNVPLSGNDNLTMFFIVTSGNKSGAEIRGVQVLNSDVSVSYDQFAGGTGGGGGASAYVDLTETESTVGTENQIEVWNAAGQLRHTDGGTWLDTISNAGRLTVWVKPSTGPGSQYSDVISQRAILPANFRSYDFIIWETASTSSDYLAGTITDFRVWPTSILGSASASNIDGSRVDWSAGNRTLSAGNTPDRFLRVVLVRGQGPRGAMGAAGAPGVGGANLSDAVPANLALAGSAGTASAASRADHVHSSVLPDDSIIPAKIRADTASQKQEWQTRIGEDESSSFIFWRSSITSAGSNGFSLLSTGTISDSTFDYEGTTYTVRKWESDGVGSFSINITPDPGSTAFNNLVAHFRGVTLKFSDATSTTSTSFLPPGFTSQGREWTWTNSHADILPTSGTTNIALAEDIGTAINELESDIAAIRQLPTGGTAGQVLTKTATAEAYQNLPALVRSTYESNAIATIAQTTVSDRVPRAVTLATLAGDHAAQGLTIASNAITVARPGLYHVNYDMDVNIVSAFQVHVNRGNTNQRGSVDKLYPHPGQEDGFVRGYCPVNITAANQNINMQWLGLDIPALSGQVPQAPSAISITRLSGNNDEFTVAWTYSGRRVNTWNIQYRFVNEVVWHTDIITINRQSARSAVVDTHHTGNTGIDVRVWGSNQSGDGLYAQRTYGTTGTDGTFTTQTAASQTVSAVGDLVIRSEEWSQ